MRSANGFWVLAFGTMSLLAITGCGPKYPKCATDTDCHEHEYCVDNMCQMCRNDSDCTDGQQCNGGRCDAIPGYCRDNTSCPSGQECRANRCSRVVTSQQEVPQEEHPTPPPAPTGCRIEAVYFDFESSDLSGGTRDQLQSIANCVRERHVAHLQIVGNTDPRGTEEYNLALGDRRARSVRDYLVSLGVNRAALGVTSQGEEMAHGTEESSWARDRRTDFLEH